MKVKKNHIHHEGHEEHEEKTSHARSLRSLENSELTEKKHITKVLKLGNAFTERFNRER